MILESIHLEGFRCFDQPLRLDGFGPGLNILSGPNGSGKSTVLRGLRHALVDSHATTGTAVKEQMQPWGRALSPRLAVVFQNGGQRWRVEKQFLQSPRARLEREENGQFRPVAEGNAAVQRLQAMFHADAPHRGLAENANLGLLQVLWTPQGRPDTPDWGQGVRAVVEASLGAVVASPKGRAIEAAVQSAALAYFTPGGKYRPSEEEKRLDGAGERLTQARAAWREASARGAQLLAVRQRAETEAGAAALAETKRKDAEARVAALSGLREKLANARASEATDRRAFERLRQAMDAIGRERSLVKELEQAVRRLSAARAAIELSMDRRADLAVKSAEFEALVQIGNDAKEWMAAQPARLIVTPEQPIRVEHGAGATGAVPGQEALFPGDGIRLPGIARIRVEASAAREKILARRPEWATHPPELELLRERYKSMKTALDAAKAGFETANSAAERELAAAETVERQLTNELAAVRAELTQRELPPDLADQTDQAAIRATAARALAEELERELATAGGDPEPAVRAAAAEERAAKSALERTLQEEARLEGQIELTATQNLYGRVTELEEEEAVLNAAAVRYRRRANALQTLRQAIAAASAELAAALPERLSGPVSEIWGRLTGGGPVALNAQWKPAAVHVPVDHLSGGEAEQVAFATRLALARHLAREERQLAVFDDAFLATDAARAAIILEILQEATAELQILILTCHPERYDRLPAAVRMELGPRY